MGRVYLAEDRLLERPVAVKFIAAGAPSEAARERFYVEARAVARLSHPNVVSVHRVGEIARRPFLVSEYVRGASLAELDKPFAPARARAAPAAPGAGPLPTPTTPPPASPPEAGRSTPPACGGAALLPKGGGAAPPPPPPPRAPTPAAPAAPVSLGESRPPADP